MILAWRSRSAAAAPQSEPERAAAPAVPEGRLGPRAARQRRAGAPRRAAAQGAVGRGRERAGRRDGRRRRRRGRRRRAAVLADVSADATLDDLRWERWGYRRRRGRGDAAGPRLRPDLRLGRQGRLPGDDPALRAAPVRPLDLLRPRARRARRRAPRQPLTCVRRVDRLMSSRRSGGAAPRRAAAMAAHRARRAGDQLAAPAARPRVGGLRPARPRAAARRPGRRRSRPACRCPTTTGRWASARPCAPRGRRARR